MRYDILAQKTGIQVLVQASSHIMVLADEPRIEQVLYNLINNAFNHNQEGGSITVRIIDGKETVKVEVTDTGSGIAVEDIGHVWDKYYKVEKINERKMVGTGLGLAIVKSILEAHNTQFNVAHIFLINLSFFF